MVSWFFNRIIGIIFIWWINSQTGSSINFKHIFTYFVVGRVFECFTNIDGIFWFDGQLANNRIDIMLLILLSYTTNGIFTYLFIKYFGQTFLFVSFNLFWISIFVIIFFNCIILPISWINFVFLPIYFVIALFIRFFLNFTIGLLVMWTVENGGILNIFTGINKILSGSLFLLNLSSLTIFLTYLPFA